MEDGETVLHRGAAPTLCWPATWRCTNGSPSSPSAATSPTCCWDTPAQVALLGGLFSIRRRSVVDPLTRCYIEQVHSQRSLHRGGRLSAQMGFTSQDMMRADVVQQRAVGG